MNDKKIAIYPGSFHPFTNGHLHILKQAAPLFDTLYICTTGTNYLAALDYIVSHLKLEGIKNVEILYEIPCSCSIEELGINYLIRALRNPNDFMHEEKIAKINAELYPGLKIIYFRADNEEISSSFVREISDNFGDISKYIPKCILDKKPRGY